MCVRATLNLMRTAAGRRNEVQFIQVSQSVWRQEVQVVSSVRRKAVGAPGAYLLTV